MSNNFSFTEYCQIITQWQKDGYPFVTDDVMRQKIAIYDEKLRELARKGNKETGEQVAYIDNLFEISERTPVFDLKGYMVQQLENYGIKKEIIEKYVEQIKNAKNEFVAPKERLANFDLMGSVADEEKLSLFRKNVWQIVDKLCCVGQKINRVLADSLEQHPLILKLEQGDFHASMGECMIKGILRPVLWMSVPDFKKLPDENVLATTLGHELGHWLDFGYRPQECLLESCLIQECFADIVGCQLVKNADYNIEPFIDRVKGFIAYFNEHKLPQYEICARKRLGLLTKIFKMPQSRNVELGKNGRIYNE